ncbi:phosphatidylinositol-specific phospholipase C [Blyttiomyces helicus]|uniref:Phosphoinositide phospholipase C n=1 Tax=Blyttiomyces helicus TaxID=388810 RepID=A0A4P9WDX8_9FUNG|nr:phosphatidylinositol-specific phospholipase C [Blyttiomyces helicus]|eukprot:RKO88566.1 phosphatidylinositol-specific phospholipase C [Blyttiomyces helicus]
MSIDKLPITTPGSFVNIFSSTGLPLDAAPPSPSTPSSPLPSPLTCAPCRKTFTSESTWLEHQSNARHIANKGKKGGGGGGADRVTCPGLGAGAAEASTSVRQADKIAASNPSLAATIYWTAANELPKQSPMDEPQRAGNSALPRQAHRPTEDGAGQSGTGFACGGSRCADCRFDRYSGAVHETLHLAGTALARLLAPYDPSAAIQRYVEAFGVRFGVALASIVGDEPPSFTELQSRCRAAYTDTVTPHLIKSKSGKSKKPADGDAEAPRPSAAARTRFESLMAELASLCERSSQRMIALGAVGMGMQAGWDEQARRRDCIDICRSIAKAKVFQPGNTEEDADDDSDDEDLEHEGNDHTPVPTNPSRQRTIRRILSATGIIPTDEVTSPSKTAPTSPPVPLSPSPTVSPTTPPVPPHSLPLAHLLAGTPLDPAAVLLSTADPAHRGAASHTLVEGDAPRLGGRAGADQKEVVPEAAVRFAGLAEAAADIACATTRGIPVQQHELALRTKSKCIDPKMQERIHRISFHYFLLPFLIPAEPDSTHLLTPLSLTTDPPQCVLPPILNLRPPPSFNYTHNMQYLTRIYPATIRVTSSNYDPVPHWEAGCQMVAMNYQTFDKGMQLNQAMFAVNGKCGYVLKPEELRSRMPGPGMKPVVMMIKVGAHPK